MRYTNRDRALRTLHATPDEQALINARIRINYPSGLPYGSSAVISAEGVDIAGRPAVGLLSRVMVAGVGICHVIEHLPRHGDMGVSLVVEHTDRDSMLRACIDAGWLPVDRPVMTRGDWPDVEALIGLIDPADDAA